MSALTDRGRFVASILEAAPSVDFAKSVGWSDDLRVVSYDRLQEAARLLRKVCKDLDHFDRRSKPRYRLLSETNLEDL